jgi:hypothetical protein
VRSLAVSPYTADAVAAALVGTRTLSFKYERYNKTNIYRGDFQTVIKGSATVKHTAFADIKRSFKFKARDDISVDWLNDRVKPKMGVLMPDGGTAWFSLGLFLMSSPAVEVSNGGPPMRTVDAYDQTVILINDKITDRYVVAAGSNVITAVSALLTSAGVTLQNLSPSTKTLPSDRDWDPGTTKLSIINSLLGSINYGSMWFDGDGYAIGRPYMTPSTIPPGWNYLDDSKSMLRKDAVSALDLFNVPNKWIGVVSEPDQTLITSVYTNSNPDSPTSTVSRGVTYVDYRTDLQAVDQASLDGIVQRIATEASQIYEKVTLKTGLMPHHEHLDVLNVRYTKISVENLYQETEWDLPMKVGATMTHSLRRLVEI